MKNIGYGKDGLHHGTLLFTTTIKSTE